MTATAVPTSPACPRCGRALPGDAPAGLCPRCLLSDGFAQSEADDRVRTGDGRRFVPPTIEELASEFPNLEFVRPLGSGGMGAVYLAKQIRLDRPIAVKVLPPDLADDPAFAERFLREARALARLSHPSIVGVFDFGQTPGGLYFFLMEFIEGPTLRQVVASKSTDPKQALEIVRQVCDALQFAHDKGVVHRDIKPENILLDSHGRVKIADFGLAKLLGLADAPAGSPAAGSLTGTRQAMGTPHYMAPEQIVGSRGVDHRADIYSLGVVFYELLTGELPLGRFAAPSKKVRIDVRLDEVVMRTLDSEPAQRYQRAGDVRTDIDVISHSAAAPRPAAAAMRFVRETTAGVGNAARTVLQPAGPGEMSRTAIVALVLAAALPIVVLAAFAVPVLILPVVMVAIGATVTGILALQEVGRSGGRLTGLVPGTAGAIAAPLALLNLLIWGLCLIPAEPFAQGVVGTYDDSVVLFCATAFALPLWVVIDPWVVRRIWRRATAGMSPDLVERELAVVPPPVRHATQVVLAWFDRTWAALRSAFGDVSPPNLPAGFVGEAARTVEPDTSMPGLPRISRKAAVGAIWATAFPIGLVLFLFVVNTHAGDPTLIAAVPLLGLVALPAMTAPFATTALGWMAVTDIRHSNGRLYGLPLATFAGLLFPVIVIDLVIAAAVTGVTVLAIVLPRLNAARDEFTMTMIGVGGFLAGLVLCVVVDTLIARAAWRRVTRGSAPAAPAGPNSVETRPRRSYRELKIAAVAFAIAVALIGVKTLRDGGSVFTPPTPPAAPVPITPGIGHTGEVVPSEMTSPSEGEEPGRRWRLGPDGPELTSWWSDFSPDLRITGSQKAEVDRVLKDVYTEYGRLLDAHTTVAVEGDAIRFTVEPIDEEMDRLSNDLWSRVDPLLDREQQAVMRYNLPLRYQSPGTGNYEVNSLYENKLMPFGGRQQFVVRIERSGQWYRWNVVSPHHLSPELSAELPLWLRRWQEKFETLDAARAGRLSIDPNRLPLVAPVPRG